MKKGLLVLLMSLSLISFAVSAGLACEPIAPAQTEFKAYSLQEFLDSVFVYHPKEDGKETGDIGAATDLEGRENLIEISVGPVYDLTLHFSDEKVVLGLDLFHGYHGIISNKEKTEEYPVFDFSIETAPEDLTIAKDEFLKGKFNPLQKKLLDAASGHKRLKIRGYINQWGYSVPAEKNSFIYIRFDLRVVDIQELPDAGK